MGTPSTVRDPPSVAASERPGELLEAVGCVCHRAETLSLLLRTGMGHAAQDVAVNQRIHVTLAGNLQRAQCKRTAVLVATSGAPLQQNSFVNSDGLLSVSMPAASPLDAEPRRTQRCHFQSRRRKPERILWLHQFTLPILSDCAALEDDGQLSRRDTCAALLRPLEKDQLLPNNANARTMEASASPLQRKMLWSDDGLTSAHCMLQIPPPKALPPLTSDDPACHQTILPALCCQRQTRAWCTMAGPCATSARVAHGHIGE